MEKIKVLHIIKSLGRGGAETLLLETLRHHDKAKFEFYYIYFFPWKNELVKQLEVQGGIVINIAAANNLQILLSIFKIKKIIGNKQIQLVHCHLPWAGIAGRFALLFNKNVKLLYTEHNIQERYHKATKLLNKFTYKWQHKVIAVSKSVEESINKNIPSKIEIQVILNGVDTNKFKRNHESAFSLKNELNIEDNKIVIGNVCVFRSQKRLKEWVDIFEKINSKHSNTIGLLVGAGILFEEIKLYIVSKNLQNKIILAGLQTNAIKYFNIIDIFFLTSEFEGLPIALLEAMSMQCVPVVTNAGGIKEVIEHNTNGLMVDVNKMNDLAAELDKILINKDLQNAIAQQTRRTIENKFSIVYTTKELENLYYALV